MHYFNQYLKSMREEKELSREKLCMGICSPEYLLSLESGERVPDSLLQDMLLERLGVGSESYENYLDLRDYERWKMRMKMFDAMVHEKWDVTEQYLETYREKWLRKKDNLLERQFLLSVQGQIGRNRGKSKEELQEIYREAVDLTMPEVDMEPLDKRALSLKELNLLLELERNSQDGGREERYLEIMNYVEKYFDGMGKSKIYPKAVYLLSQCKHKLSTKELLQICDTAIEYLRNTSRLYYIWEMLELRENLLDARLCSLIEGSNGIMRELAEMREQNSEWKKALEEVYEEFHVRKEMFEDSYLYVMKGVQCVNDVIRIRRKMLGMSREELCGTHRDVKTLQRLENKQNAPHWSTVSDMFAKLGLPTEYARNTLLTQDHFVMQKMEQIERCINTYQWLEADILLEELCKKIPVNNIHNRQALLQKQALTKWKVQEIDRTEYMNRMQEALELTIPFATFLEVGEKYLTDEEQTCIQNLMQHMDKDSEAFKTCILRFEEYYSSYVDNGLFQAVDGMYSFVMKNIASGLGNQGEFERANRYDEIIAEGYLRSRRLRMIPLVLYDRWWNREECRKKGIPIPDMNSNKELEKIIRLANLDKQYKRERHYRSKM